MRVEIAIGPDLVILISHFLMPRPSIGPKMFWADPYFLSRTFLTCGLNLIYADKYSLVTEKDFSVRVVGKY